MSELIEQHRDELPFSDQITTFDPPKHKARSRPADAASRRSASRRTRTSCGAAPTARSTRSSRRRCELVGDFAGPFTLYVIADLLGVPEAHHETFREQLQGGHGAGARREHRKLDARQPLEFLYDQLTAYVEERRREPWTTCSRSWPRPRSRTGRRPR